MLENSPLFDSNAKEDCWAQARLRFASSDLQNAHRSLPERAKTNVMVQN